MFCFFRLKESGTDISFHPEQNLLTVGNIQGEISVFRVENEVGIREMRIFTKNMFIKLTSYGNIHKFFITFVNI